MVQSKFKSYDELPLFLNARTVAQVLGRVFVSGKQATSRPSRQARLIAAGAYELLHQENFPVLKIGSRLVVPKEKFLSWIEIQTGGSTL